MAAERCIHDVHPQACLTCEPFKPKRWDQETLNLPPRVRARFPGECRACGQDVKPGQSLTLVEGVWICCD